MEEILKKYFIENNWKINSDNSVEKDFVFANFISAFTWMTKIALSAEKLDHHPDWKNAFNRIYVNLKTHDKNKVTEKDLELAKIMDESFEREK